jgi:hypothetical protein
LVAFPPAGSTYASAKKKKAAAAGEGAAGIAAAQVLEATILGSPLAAK